uniref:hypothetical protein n=1 Tax=Neisseria sicca TaxID=490 RepID=UPI001C9A0D88
MGDDGGGEFGGFVDVVGNEKDSGGEFFVNEGEGLVKGRGGEGVEGGEGLVDEEDVGFGGENGGLRLDDKGKEGGLEKGVVVIEGDEWGGMGVFGKLVGMVVNGLEMVDGSDFWVRLFGGGVIVAGGEKLWEEAEMEGFWG